MADTQYADRQVIHSHLLIEGPYGAEIICRVVFSKSYGGVWIAEDIEDDGMMAWAKDGTLAEEATDVLASIFEGNGCKVTIEDGSK